MMYRIRSTKGDDYYNDPDTYPTKADAEQELTRVRAWAAEQAKIEPSYQNAEFEIVSIEAA